MSTRISIFRPTKPETEALEDFSKLSITDNDTDAEKDVVLMLTAGVLMQGDMINLALSESDISVLVGESVCEITSMSSTQLTCLPTHLHLRSTSPPALSSVRVYRLILRVRCTCVRCYVDSVGIFIF